MIQDQNVQGKLTQGVGNSETDESQVGTGGGMALVYQGWIEKLHTPTARFKIHPTPQKNYTPPFQNSKTKSILSNFGSGTVSAASQDQKITLYPKKFRLRWAQ